MFDSVFSNNSLTKTTTNETSKLASTKDLGPESLIGKTTSSVKCVETTRMGNTAPFMPPMNKTTSPTNTHTQTAPPSRHQSTQMILSTTAQNTPPGLVTGTPISYTMLVRDPSNKSTQQQPQQQQQQQQNWLTNPYGQVVNSAQQSSQYDLLNSYLLNNNPNNSSFQQQQQQFKQPVNSAMFGAGASASASASAQQFGYLAQNAATSGINPFIAAASQLPVSQVPPPPPGIPLNNQLPVGFGMNHPLPQPPHLHPHPYAHGHPHLHHPLLQQSFPTASDLIDSVFKNVNTRSLF